LAGIFLPYIAPPTQLNLLIYSREILLMTQTFLSRVYFMFQEISGSHNSLAFC